MFDCTLKVADVSGELLEVHVDDIGRAEVLLNFLEEPVLGRYLITEYDAYFMKIIDFRSQLLDITIIFPHVSQHRVGIGFKRRSDQWLILIGGEKTAHNA